MMREGTRNLSLEPYHQLRMTYDSFSSFLFDCTWFPDMILMRLGSGVDIQALGVCRVKSMFFQKQEDSCR